MPQHGTSLQMLFGSKDLPPVTPGRFLRGHSSSGFNVRRHWRIAITILFIDVTIVAATICVNIRNYVPPPQMGIIDKSDPIGWLGVFGAIFIFGCYGIVIKTPAVQAADCDCMVFQLYYSIAMVLTSAAIWIFAGRGEAVTLTGSSFSMGVLFGSLWIINGIFGYIAITNIGYAVAFAIWVGVTIIVSFAWGIFVFQTDVSSWPLAIAALVLLLLGVFLAAVSYMMSSRESPMTPTTRSTVDGRMIVGAVSALAVGLCNGSLMVPLNCFQDGCSSIGVEAYAGKLLPAFAFLPSLSLGVVVAQPVLFMLYWGPSMICGNWPKMHFKHVAPCGLLTGCFWAMGFFHAMIATEYLGDTIGYPLSQCCLIIAGIWGIIYFEEICGKKAIATFVLSSFVILAGATLDGLS